MYVSLIRTQNSSHVKTLWQLISDLFSQSTLVSDVGVQREGNEEDSEDRFAHRKGNFHPGMKSSLLASLGPVSGDHNSGQGVLGSPKKHITLPVYNKHFFFSQTHDLEIFSMAKWIFIGTNLFNFNKV